MRAGLATVFFGLTVLGGLSVRADDESPLAEARRLLQTGDLTSAADAYQNVLDDAAVTAEDRTAAVLGLSRAMQQRGLWEAAANVVADELEQVPNNADLLARRAELQFLRGEDEAAAKNVQAALAVDEEQLLAHLIQAHLAAEHGDYDAAVDGYRWFVRYYNREQPTDAPTLLLVAEGSLQYARWKRVTDIFDFVVNTLSVDALKDDPLCWQASLLAGELLLEKYNKPQAEAEFAAALAVNPRAAEVFVAQGRLALVDAEIENAIEAAKQALTINPALPSALLLAADASIATGELKPAMEFIEQARKINPVDSRTLARLAGVFLLDDGVPEREEFELLLQRESATGSDATTSRFLKTYDAVLARNPSPGLFLAEVGEILDAHRKYDAAELCYRRAIEVMPQLSSPRTSLGMLAMRTGNLEEAQSILDAAFKADPFHVRVSNMRKVLGQLSEYDTVTSDHFVIRVPREERLLGEAMSEYLEESYTELTTQFGFEPETRTQFEVYGSAGGTSAHQWFSARMVGLPWVQTVGASTGKIVALASPHGSDEPFNWARVVRHEFAHVLTLQQTRFNIPHWYTEALAVRTEGITPAEWDTMLLRRVPADEVFTLSDINGGFQRPKDPEDWQMAYCQSWLYATYIAERFGEDAHARLLDAYRRNLPTGEAIAEACGIAVEQFESEYSDYLDDYVDGLRQSRVAPPMSVEEAQAKWREDPTDRKLQAQLAWAMWNANRKREASDIAEKLLEDRSDLPLAIAIVAELLIDEGETTRAEELIRTLYDPTDPQPELLERLAMLHSANGDWEQATRLWQTAVDRWPREPAFLKGLAASLLRQGDSDGLRPVLEQLAGLDADDLLTRKKLATMAHEAADWPEAIRWARAGLHIDVTDETLHTILADAYGATGDTQRAERERKIIERLRNSSEGGAP